MLRAGREEAGDLGDAAESDMEDEMIDGYDLKRSLVPGCRVCAEEVPDKEEAITAIAAEVNGQSPK